MRYIIVSNRLPVTVNIENGNITTTESVGGLATGLASLHEKTLWVGWPGADVPEELQEEVASRLGSAIPVFLPACLSERFYHGFCNKILWPLFHYFPSLVSYRNEYYDAYVEANELFAQALAKVIRPGDIIWVQDYHLLLLPGMLRERFPDAQIGFFLHIPFPHAEMFQMLPQSWRKALLNGMLGANLIGFHTDDYTRHFLRCVLRTIGIEDSMRTLIIGERLIRVDTFPMGIDFSRFHDAEPRSMELNSLHTDGTVKVLLSIDRLDYTKGILERLLAYEQFLNAYPQWREKVVMITVVVPSRTGIDQYQHMKKQLDEMIGRINGRFATLSWMPIIYQYRTLGFEELCTYYRHSDVALVTSLRDGMNLIAKEYVASRRDGTGVLVLSEAAGAAREMGEALIINPNDITGTAAAINSALNMPINEQKRRNRIMQQRLQKHDIAHWADTFLADLQIAYNEQRRLRAHMLSATERQNLLESCRRASKPLFLLDYDGTLAKLATHPSQAKPDAPLLALLERCARTATVVIVSGRDKATLDSWFGHLPIDLIAEHGLFMKRNKTWTASVVRTGWRQKVLAICKRYADRLPGAFVEQKECTVAWHYRAADPESGALRAKEIMDSLTALTANTGLQVMQGHKVIEVKPATANKGSTAASWIDGKDFILAIGDDTTDEDLFTTMPKAYTLRVGMAPSNARYNIRCVDDVRALLEDLVKERITVQAH